MAFYNSTKIIYIISKFSKVIILSIFNIHINQKELRVDSWCMASAFLFQRSLISLNFFLMVSTLYLPVWALLKKQVSKISIYLTSNHVWCICCIQNEKVIAYALDDIIAGVEVITLAANTVTQVSFLLLNIHDSCVTCWHFRSHTNWRHDSLFVLWFVLLMSVRSLIAVITSASCSVPSWVVLKALFTESRCTVTGVTTTDVNFFNFGWDFMTSTMSTNFALRSPRHSLKLRGKHRVWVCWL